MHGLILAGGAGSRLAADGVSVPKAFVRVGGRPQLITLVEQFASLGCSEITCLLQRDAYEWSRAVRGARLPAAVRLIPCSTPSSLHTLARGLDALSPGDVFCSMVDTVMDVSDWERVYGASRHALREGADAVLAITPYAAEDDAPLWVHRMLDAGDAATSRVVEIGGVRPSPPWITGGVYAFGPVARARAGTVLAAGHERMRAFLSALVADGGDVRAVEVERIIDVDHARDLEAANAFVARVAARSS